MTKEMFEEITAWQDMVFTKATAISALNHLLEEIRELQAEFSSSSRFKQRRLEFADCFLLLFGAAHKDGMTYDIICEVINEKMQINKTRKLGEVNEQGYVKHISSDNDDKKTQP